MTVTLLIDGTMVNSLQNVKLYLKHEQSINVILNFIHRNYLLMVIKQTIRYREKVNFHRKTYNKMFVLFSNFFLIKFKEKYLYVSWQT